MILTLLILNMLILMIGFGFVLRDTESIKYTLERILREMRK